MIDERIRIQENYDMTLETAIDEAREEGLEQGRKQLVCEMVSRGMTPELISEMTGLSLEEIETLLSKVEEIKECMVYGKEEAGEKELIITARVIPDYERIEELHGADLSEDEVYKVIWEQIKKVNRKLSNYKTIKKLEIKTDEFEKTSTMKIKRYAELAKK